MDTQHRHFIPIWFFIGCLLLIYGVLILGASVFGADTSGTVLANLHAGIWWGILLIGLGGFYTFKFWPKE